MPNGMSGSIANWRWTLLLILTSKEDRTLHINLIDILITVKIVHVILLDYEVEFFKV